MRVSNHHQNKATMKIRGEAVGALGEVKDAWKPQKCPPRCKALLKQMESEVSQLAPTPGMEHLQRDYLHSEIKQLRKALEQATTKAEEQKIQKLLDDKQWTLDNLPVLYRNECALTYPALVCGLKYDRSCGWQAKVWISPKQHLIVEVEEHYVKWLLTDLAYECGKYHKASTKFAKIEKYHLQKDLDEIQFFKFKDMHDGTYNLVDEYMTTVPASAAWVKKNIDAELLSPINADEGGWIHNTFGSCATSTVALPVLSARVLARNPKVLHKNSGNQCVLMALASALAYMGKDGMAESIASASKKYGLKRCGVQFKEFVSIVGTMLHVPCRKTDYKNGLTTEVRRENPVVVALRGWKDGRVCSLNHCVCFVGNLVFDSNLDVALETTKKNLDLICNNVLDGASYDGIYWAREVMIVQKPKQQKK